MSLSISSADVARLAAAQTALLSPLDHGSPGNWANAVMDVVRPLLGADQAFFAAPEDTADWSVVRLWGQGTFTEAAAEAYARHFHSVDPGRAKALDFDVFSIDMVFDRSEYDRTEILVDWCTPYRLLDTIGMSVKSEGGFSAVLSVYHDRLDGSLFGDRGLGLLRLLLPAFKSGVQTSLRLAQHQASFVRLIDDVGVGLAVCDTAGRIVHQNRALSLLLANEPEGVGLRIEVRRVAAAIAATLPLGSPRTVGPPVAPLASEMQTTGARYRVRGTYAGNALAGTDAAILVLVERVNPEPFPDSALRERYGLTAREVQVAHLLAEGKTNANVADALAISSHTAERHTEHVLSKLGVRSRASVGAKLVDG
jgi:DNA-binding CsgD family transcriptional regulator